MFQFPLKFDVEEKKLCFSYSPLILLDLIPIPSSCTAVAAAGVAAASGAEGDVVLRDGGGGGADGGGPMVVDVGGGGDGDGLETVMLDGDAGSERSGSPARSGTAGPTGRKKRRKRGVKTQIQHKLG